MTFQPLPFAGAPGQGQQEHPTGAAEELQRRKDAERAGHEAQALLRSIMDSMGPGVVVLDAAGTIVHVNGSWEASARAGGAPEALCRGVGQDYFGILHQILPPDPAERALVGLRAVLQGRLERFDLDYPREDALAPRWFHLGATPLTGDRARLVVIHTDISTRREADCAIRNSEERFSAVFHASPVAILLARLEDKVILDANPAFQTLSGLSLERLRGVTSQSLGFWGRDEDRQFALAELTGGRPVRDLEVAFRGAGGAPGVAQLSMDLVELGGEQVMVAFFQDVTEIRAAREKEREMERELQHLQRLESVGRLAGGISHDMNNVLGAIFAMSSVLQAKFPDQPEVAQCSEAILLAAGRGRDLVKGLTDFARKEVQDAVPLDLNALVRREADLLERTTFRKVAILLELEDRLPKVLGEASALANTLMNLCVNAWDAMPDGGTLTLATRLLPDGRVEVAVGDTGEGMPPEVAARALEPFFTTKAPGKGTGLGLSIVYGTVKAHGGTVDIQTGPGAGTRVALTFPPMGGLGAALPAPAPAYAGPERRLKVLLVDDDELIRQTVPLLLKALGHGVEVASGGQEALRRLEAGFQADLVILDVNMPGLSGLQTLGRLRILRPELPVLVSTGFRDAALTAAIQGFTKVGTLDKPFLLDDLKRALGQGG